MRVPPVPGQLSGDRGDQQVGGGDGEQVGAAAGGRGQADDREDTGKDEQRRRLPGGDARSGAEQAQAGEGSRTDTETL